MSVPDNPQPTWTERVRRLEKQWRMYDAIQCPVHRAFHKAAMGELMLELLKELAPSRVEANGAMQAEPAAGRN